ncbi:HesB/YadR/YfhF family protein [Secundilactobacillus malefermentans]|uniref:FeS cluster biogenesis domain-containing protein n=1 Tax=Secundilactobacillus malefermentans TaxID=176292 RepID=A0A4R5NT37_9LACO|nr:iron-sulfur cluster biosynthesis protein [Secundilactobacillus malefermentans]QEA32478.1 iron-sulfur cluster biosynthesis protein [Secundilactobacillus malefermentans]TDG80445.1 hypothetical protein C5L31_000811 [Secundilactobacillus malefermentans]
MKITVTDKASKWFKDDMGLDDGSSLRFYGKVYGNTPVHDGFSLAMTPDGDTSDAYALTEKDGVNYYVTEADEWFFKGYDLEVDYDAKHDGPQYNYIQNNEL